jgi:hypothetical protein
LSRLFLQLGVGAWFQDSCAIYRIACGFACEASCSSSIMRGPFAVPNMAATDPNSSARPIVRWLAILLMLGLCLLLVEVALRVQDRYFGWVELSGLQRLDDAQSDLTHHRRDDQPGDDYIELKRFPADCKTPDERWLVMGDSWVVNGEAIASLGPKLAAKQAKCLEFLNGGVASFAVSTGWIKTRLILAREQAAGRRVDGMLWHLDQTDLMDEWLRYRDHLIRDRSGKLQRVSRDSLRALHPTLLKTSERHSLYSVRLLDKLFLTRYLVPRVERAMGGVPLDLLAPLRNDYPAAQRAEYLAHFQALLDEALLELKPQFALGVILAVHPHFLHRQSGPTGYGEALNAAIGEVAMQHQLPLLNARASFADTAEASWLARFNWPADAFSHPSPLGYQRYGEWLADVWPVGAPIN